MSSLNTIDANEPVKINAQNQESVDMELFLNVILDNPVGCFPQKIQRDLYRNGRRMDMNSSKSMILSFSGNENSNIPSSSNANVENDVVKHELIQISMPTDMGYANRVKRIRDQINRSAEEYYNNPKVNSLKVHLFLFFYRQGDPAINLIDSLNPINEEDAKKKIKDLFKKPILKHRKVKYSGIEYIGSFDPVEETTYFDKTVNLLSDKEEPTKQDVLDAAVMCQFVYDSQTESDSSIIEVVCSKIKSLFSSSSKKVVTDADRILDNNQVDIGWKMMSSKEVDNLIANDKNFKLKSKVSGFFSQLFCKKSQSDENLVDVKYAYCTAGTYVTSVADWFSNISQGLIGWAPQYIQSVRNAKILDKALAGKTLFFIGHSLGGGLASNNALVTSDRHAITFNAAGLNILRVKATLLINNRNALFHIDERRKRIHPYIIRGEILHVILGLVGQMPYGYDKEHSFVQDDTTIIEKIRKTVDRHGLKGFIEDVKFRDTLNANYSQYIL